MKYIHIVEAYETEIIHSIQENRPCLSFFLLAYIDKAVMELQTHNRGCTSGFSDHGPPNHLSYNQFSIWAGLGVESRLQLRGRNDHLYKEEGEDKRVELMHVSFRERREKKQEERKMHRLELSNSQGNYMKASISASSSSSIFF